MSLSLSPTKTNKTRRLNKLLTLAMRTCWTKRRLMQIFGWCWIRFFPLALTHLSWCQKLRLVTICYDSSRKQEKHLISMIVIYLHNGRVTKKRIRTAMALVAIFILPTQSFNKLLKSFCFMLVYYQPKRNWQVHISQIHNLQTWKYTTNDTQHCKASPFIACLSILLTIFSKRTDKREIISQIKITSYNH